MNSAATTTTSEVTASYSRRANKWWTVFRERGGEAAADRLKGVSVTDAATSEVSHEDSHNGENELGGPSSDENRNDMGKNNSDKTMADSLPESELLRLNKGHESDNLTPDTQQVQIEDQGKEGERIPEKEGGTNESKSDDGVQPDERFNEPEPAPRFVAATRFFSSMMSGSQLPHTKQHVAKIEQIDHRNQGTLEDKGSMPENEFFSQMEPTRRDDQEAEHQDGSSHVQGPSLPTTEFIKDKQNQELSSDERDISGRIGMGKGDSNSNGETAEIGGEENHENKGERDEVDDEMIQKVAEIVKDASAHVVKIQQRHEELQNLKETGWAAAKRRKQELDALSKTKNSKARELWFKEHRAKRFIAFSEFRDTLMKMSLPAHDTSSSTLTMEAKLLRARHHEWMAGRQRDIQQQTHQDMIEHMWSILPEIRHEKELAEMVGSNQVEKLRQTKDEMVANYEAHLSVQRKIIAKFHLRELEDEALERRHMESRASQPQPQTGNIHEEDDANDSMAMQQHIQALRIASGDVKPGTAELRGSAEKRLLERQAAVERLQARKQRQAELAKERQAKSQVMTQSNRRALERVSSNMETIRSVQERLENGGDDSLKSLTADDNEGGNAYNRNLQEDICTEETLDLNPSGANTRSKGHLIDAVSKNIKDVNIVSKYEGGESNGKSEPGSVEVDQGKSVFRDSKASDNTLDGSIVLADADTEVEPVRTNNDSIELAGRGAEDDGKDNNQNASMSQTSLENNNSSIRQQGDPAAAAAAGLSASTSRLKIQDNKRASEFSPLSPRSFSSSFSGSSPRRRPGSRVVNTRRNRVRPTPGGTADTKVSTTTDTSKEPAHSAVRLTGSPRAGRLRVFSPSSPRPSPRSPRGSVHSPRSPGGRKVSPGIRRDAVAATASPTLGGENTQASQAHFNDGGTESAIATKTSSGVASPHATAPIDKPGIINHADPAVSDTSDGVRGDVSLNARSTKLENRGGGQSLLHRAQAARTGRGSNMADRSGIRSGRGRGNLLDRARSARLQSSVTGGTAGVRGAGVRASTHRQNGFAGESEVSKAAVEDSTVPDVRENSRGAIQGGDSKARTSIAAGRRARQSSVRSARAGRGRGNLLDRAQSARVRSSAGGGIGSGRGGETNRASQQTASANNELAESEHGTTGTNPRSSRIRGSRLSRR